MKLNNFNMITALIYLGGVVLVLMLSVVFGQTTDQRCTELSRENGMQAVFQDQQCFDYYSKLGSSSNMAPAFKKYHLKDGSYCWKHLSQCEL